MSLITDLLSKIRQEDPKRDIPPLLRDSIREETARRAARKRLAIYAIVLVVVVSGFGAIFLWESMFWPPANAPKAKHASPAVEPVSSVAVPLPPPPLEVARPLPPQFPLEAARPAPSPAAAKAAHSAVKPKATSKPVRHARRKSRNEISKQQTASLPAAALQPEEKKEPDSDVLKPKAEIEKKISAQDDKDFYLYAARTSELQKNYRQALANYKKVMEIEPENFVVMNNIACAMIHLGAYEEAIEHAKGALSIKKDHVSSLINLGVAYGRLGRHPESEGYFLRAQFVEPKNRFIMLNLGLIYEKAGALDKAGGYFSALSEAGDSQGYLGLARIAEQQKRTTDAVSFYKTVISLEKAGSQPWNCANERLMQLTR